MSNADLASQTPAQIDAALAALLNRKAVSQNRVDNAQRILTNIAEGKLGYSSYNADVYQGEIEAGLKAITELNAEIAPLNAEFAARGGWTRSYLVNNSNGHLHTSMNCGTCFITTQYAWMTELSGMSAEELVDMAGERACTVCFPDAPVAKLAQPTRVFTADEKAAQARREELAAKRAAAATQVVIDPATGKQLFKTERAATNEISSLLGSAHWYGDSEYFAKALKIADALAAKRDMDVLVLWAELTAKAEKKFAAEAKKALKDLTARGIEIKVENLVPGLAAYVKAQAA